MTVEKLITDHIDIWSSALQTRSTAGRGSNGKIDLYGIKKLRELILELAVRGKLVPQDPNDEPASELLKQIAKEREELVKSKAIRKPKALEKIAITNTPFDLPDGWEWCYLNDIGDWGLELRQVALIRNIIMVIFRGSNQVSFLQISFRSQRKVLQSLPCRSVHSEIIKSVMY